jgi:hypothetical protein
MPGRRHQPTVRICKLRRGLSRKTGSRAIMPITTFVNPAECALRGVANRPKESSDAGCLRTSDHRFSLSRTHVPRACSGPEIFDGVRWEGYRSILILLQFAGSDALQLGLIEFPWMRAPAALKRALSSARGQISSPASSGVPSSRERPLGIPVITSILRDTLLLSAHVRLSSAVEATSPHTRTPNKPDSLDG